MSEWMNGILGHVCANPVKTEHVYTICTMSDQRRRRGAEMVQMTLGQVKTHHYIIFFFRPLHSKGFCQVEKFKKFEKNSEVGGWVKPQLRL